MRRSVPSVRSRSDSRQLPPHHDASKSPDQSPIGGIGWLTSLADHYGELTAVVLVCAAEQGHGARGCCDQWLFQRNPTAGPSASERMSHGPPTGLCCWLLQGRPFQQSLHGRKGPFLGRSNRSGNGRIRRDTGMAEPTPKNARRARTWAKRRVSPALGGRPKGLDLQRTRGRYAQGERPIGTVT